MGGGGNKNKQKKLQSYFVAECKNHKWLLIQQCKLFRILAAVLYIGKL